jgi:UDP-glucose:(heptosyl)LPS alpha-1,3-glucosyltransferase
MKLLALAVLAGVAVRRGRWDVVQSHERVLGADVYRAGEGCHRAYLAALGPLRGRRLYHRIVLALERRVLTRTPRIVAIARRGKTEVERLYGVPPESVTVVYNGVDLDRFHPRHRHAHRARARDEAGVAKDDHALLFVGSGFDRKGLATALDTLHALPDPASRLIVVGKGDQRPFAALATRLGVDDRVTWLGPRRDIERWYAAADVLVLPARYEPFGNVHLEALASGVPVVTSTAAGGAELIVDGVNGAVRAPRDATGMAQAVVALRARGAGDLAAACRQSVAPFTYARQVTELAGIWGSVTAVRR